jgi:hypothetical protein
MVTYPIRIARNGYRGADPKRQRKAYLENQAVNELEQKINDLLLKQASPIHIYLWHEISIKTGVPLEIVKKLGYTIDAGSNGFTAWRHDLTYGQAIDLVGGQSES